MFRIIVTLAGFGLMALGFGASAIALTHGEIDQAIAFTWPTASLAVALGLVLSLARSSGRNDPA